MPGDAARDVGGEPAHAVRAHDDQVALPRMGRGDDRFAGAERVGRFRFAGHACAPRTGGHGPGVSVGLAEQRLGHWPGAADEPALGAAQVDALVMVGGDSSMDIAACLQGKGLPAVGVPKTIDNDLDGTNQTFGFDTAVGFATECIDRLHTTADSQHRVMVVEVMGRYAGWIALHAGLAGGAHAILLPEIPFDIDAVAQAIARRQAAGRGHAIVVAAEGAQPRGGRPEVRAAPGAGHAERLGGIGAWVETALAGRLDKECRSVVLGHLLRGGSPSSFDRVAASRFGAAAVRALAQGQSGVMVALDGEDIVTVPLADVAGRNRRVPVDGDTVRTARELGICFGDSQPFG